LSGPLAGWLCNRFSRKTLVLGAMLFWSAVTVSTAFALGYRQLIICRALGGLGEAFCFPASMSLISDYLAKPPRAMSIHQPSVYAGTIAGGYRKLRLGDSPGRDPLKDPVACSFDKTALLS
jgi:MFS family permease